MAFSPERILSAHRDLVAKGQVKEGIILSTCNRTEIYYHSTQSRRDAVLRWLTDYHGIDPSLLDGHIYHHEQDDAVRHLFRVACGLDSMVLGEPQILGQIKDAYQNAVDSRATGPLLNRLLHWAFRVAKKVRSDTAIGSEPVSIAYAAVSLARRLLGSLEGKDVLLIGAGETIELVAQHLLDHGVGSFAVANRSREHAELLAERLNGVAVSLAEIPGCLPRADIVVSSTASPTPILTRSTVAEALPPRNEQELMLVDLAVPRDIAPEVANLPNCYLYTIDDLTDIAQEGLRLRQEAAREAEVIIGQEVEAFQRWRESLGVVPAIRRLRDRVERQREQELKRFQNYILQGQEPAAVLEAFSRALMNKILHDPTASLREPCQDASSETLVAALDILFHLSDAEG